MKRYLTITHAVLVMEILLFSIAALSLLFGGRDAVVEQLRRHADLLTILFLLGFFALVHLVITRRVVRFIENRLSPARYDERRILLDLGQEARTATNLDQLYDSIIRRIKEALETEAVSIFVRDDATRDYVCRTGEPLAGSRERAIERRPVLARDAFVVTRLRHLASPLALEPGDLDAWSRALDSAPREVRAARERESDALKRLKTRLLLQIKIKEQLVGIVSLGPRRRAQHKYSTKDKEMLMSVAGQLAFVIENARLIERIVVEEQLRRELLVAAEVQQGLLPSEPPPSAHLELAGFCEPARGIGGDYYDFIPLGNGQTGIAIADVAGKGISAALVMSNVQASLRSQIISKSAAVKSPASPVELVSNINRLLCQSTGSATYVTFFYAQFDERTRELTYINAGHNPPLLYRRSHSLEPASTFSEQTTALTLPAAHRDTANGCLKLSTGGPVVGFFEHCRYEQGRVQLQSGDLLIAYTDGLTEALNISGEEFGEQRLEETVKMAASGDAVEVRAQLIESIKTWCAGTPQHDDLTFIVLKVK